MESHASYMDSMTDETLVEALLDYTQSVITAGAEK